MSGSAAAAGLRQRLERRQATIALGNALYTRNLTGPLGAQPHVIRL